MASRRALVAEAEPTVAVFSLGGTIAMTRDPNSGGVVPALGARQLLGAIPQLAELGVRLEVSDFLRKPGASLTVEDLLGLHRAILDVCADGAAGIVITQGTDTIEESAYLLDLLHGEDAPIVVTGAMRNPTVPGADGPANLTAAIVAAADPAMRGTGCSVAMNDELHTALHVRKTHTTSPAAFQSPACGRFASVREGRLRMAWNPRAQRPLFLDPPEPGSPIPKVAVVTAGLGDDGRLLEPIAQACDGLVLAAFGGGHVPAAWLPTIARFAPTMPVVLTSRIGHGSTLEGTYSFEGSEMSLEKAGVINGGILAPYQARLALRLLLARGTDLAAIRTTVYALGRRA
jgi:L-asparaginase